MYQHSFLKCKNSILAGTIKLILVKKVDKNSGQLRDAINDGVGIIITTLQKFPVIYKEVDSANKRFAIIIDEAHSSQTGDAAKKLKRALADIPLTVTDCQALACQ